MSVYNTMRWRLARKIALERDGYACTFVEYEDQMPCGETVRLHVHHLVLVSEGGDPYDLDNLITVCPSHHAQWHAMKRRDYSIAA